MQEVYTSSKWRVPNAQQSPGSQVGSVVLYRRLYMLLSANHACPIQETLTFRLSHSPGNIVCLELD